MLTYLCLGRPCFSSSDLFLFCWAVYLSISLLASVFPVSLPPTLLDSCANAWLGSVFVHGHTFLHSWSGPMTLIVGLLHGATFLSNLTLLLFMSFFIYKLSSWCWPRGNWVPLLYNGGMRRPNSGSTSYPRYRGGPRPSIDKARDSSFNLISLAAVSLLYNTVSTIRYLFCHFACRKHCMLWQWFLHTKWQKRHRIVDNVL